MPYDHCTLQFGMDIRDHVCNFTKKGLVGYVCGYVIIPNIQPGDIHIFSFWSEYAHQHHHARLNSDVHFICHAFARPLATLHNPVSHLQS